MTSVTSAESPRSRNNRLDNTSSSSTRRHSPALVDGRGARSIEHLVEERSQSVELRDQEAVLARVKEELESWESLVFSFDMDRSGKDDGNERGAGNSGSGNSGRGRRNTRSGSERNIDPQDGSQDSLDRILSGTAFSGAAPQQQQINQLAHLAQLAQLSQLNAQYNLGFDLNTLNQLAAMNVLSPSLNPSQQAPNVPPSHAPPDDAVAQMLRQLQSQGTFSGANPDANNAIPTFPFPPHSLQSQPHQQPYMQAAQSQGLQPFPWPPTPVSAPPFGQNMPGGSSHQGITPQQQRPQPSFLPPLAFPPSSGMYNFSASPPTSNAAAGPGPSTMRQAGSVGSRAMSASPTTSQDGGDLDDALVQEDKRRRNTAASARFRIKKKHKVLSLEKSVSELEGRAEDLEREAADLRRENGWLKEMLIMKGRRNRGLDQGPSTGQDDGEDSEDEGSRAGEGSKKDGDDEDKQESKGDPKGKGKAKDSS